MQLMQNINQMAMDEFQDINHKTDYSSLLHKSSFIEATLCYANPASLRLHKSSLNEATTWTQHERGYNNPALKSLHKPSLNQASKIEPQRGYTYSASIRLHKCSLYKERFTVPQTTTTVLWRSNGERRLVNDVILPTKDHRFYLFCCFVDTPIMAAHTED